MSPVYWESAKRQLAQKDPMMAALFKAFPRISLESRGEPFFTLVRSIVGQQISVKAAESIWNRVTVLVPDMRPSMMLNAGEFQLRACGLSGRKIEYIIHLSQLFQNGSLCITDWQYMPDEEVVADLVRVKGIGRWTAEMFLMFNLLRPDVLPIDDLGLQKAVSHYYFFGETVSREGLRDLAETWRPWRSVATWYLWRGLEPMSVAY